MPSLASLAQSFLKPKDPSSQRFSTTGACNLHPTGTTPPMDFKLAQYACELRVWDQWCLPFDLEVRANF